MFSPASLFRRSRSQARHKAIAIFARANKGTGKLILNTCFPYNRLPPRNTDKSISSVHLTIKSTDNDFAGPFSSQPLARIVVEFCVIDFPPRHAISRTRFFLQMAELCSANDREDFEAYLEAAIIFARTAILRLEFELSKHPDWIDWWSSLLSDETTELFRVARNWIVHQAPPKISQVVRLGSPAELARDLYYYEASDVLATITVGQYVD